MTKNYSIVEMKISPIGSSNKPVRVTIIETDCEAQPVQMTLLPGAEAQYLYVSTGTRMECREIEENEL